MKRKETKALKPSEMGLHSTVRYTVVPQGANRTEQERSIVATAIGMHAALCPYLYPDGGGAPHDMTRKFARFLSKCLTFAGFADEEVFRILAREADRRRKALV